jgi:hypothetical protein
MAVNPSFIPNSYYFEQCKGHHAFPSVMSIRVKLLGDICGTKFA